MKTVMTWEEKQRKSARFAAKTAVCTLVLSVGFLLVFSYAVHLLKAGYLDQIESVNAEYADAARTAQECETFSEHSRREHREKCEHKKSIWMAGKSWLYLERITKHFVSDMGGDFFVTLYHQSPFGLALLLSGVGTLAIVLFNHGPIQAWRLFKPASLEDQEALFTRQLLGAALTDSATAAALHKRTV
jgi:hypothetical protein